MTSKWVDNEIYFGPDRRRGGLGKRWGDRRHVNDAAKPPPLGAVLRRLRVHLFDMTTEEDRRRTIQLADLAITEAEQRRLPACADALNQAARLIREGDTDGTDTLICAAMAIESAA